MRNTDVPRLSESHLSELCILGKFIQKTGNPTNILKIWKYCEFIWNIILKLESQVFSSFMKLKNSC